MEILSIYSLETSPRLFSTCFPSQISPRIQRGIMLIYHFFNLEAKYPLVHRRYCTVWASHWIVQMNHSKALTHSGAKHMTAFISESLMIKMISLNELIQEWVSWLSFWMSRWISCSTNLFVNPDSFRNEPSLVSVLLCSVSVFLGAVKM